MAVFCFCSSNSFIASFSCSSLPRSSTAWKLVNEGGSVPQLHGAKWFTLEDIRKCRENFSQLNCIGVGGYGKVYKGTIPSGQVVAIKRAQKYSMQGAHEFKTEIELLSRIHHKNVVRLVGFCADQGEQMLVYECISNGTLKDSLSGKSGHHLDWTTRMRIALDAARGLSYLHELADPPIIHRDIKSPNILLDNKLIAKIADFGLSKLVGDPGKGYISTQVKGTLGYMDPEYFMTQQLTEKSDVYSFGIVLLELTTARAPIHGQHIVKWVKDAMEETSDPEMLYQIVDPKLELEWNLVGLHEVIDMALRCVRESSSERLKMGEIVRTIERIMGGMMDSVNHVIPSSSYGGTPGSSSPLYSVTSEGLDVSYGSFPFHIQR